MSWRRARGRSLLIPFLSLFAACETETIPESSGYGARWWLEAPLATPEASVSPTGTPPAAVLPIATASPTATATLRAAPTVVSSATPTVVATMAPIATPTESPTPIPTPGFRCEPAVLESEPSEPFDLLGLIEVQPHRPGIRTDGPLAAAKLQACALGGDAIVILYRNERQGASPSVIIGPGGMLPNPELRAAVIRYRRTTE